MRRALIVVVAAVILSASGASAVTAHPGPLPKVATGVRPVFGPPFAVRPHSIWFTPDSTGVLGRIANNVPAVGKRPGFLHWKTWTRDWAYGVGIEWYKNGGGAGRFQRTSVTITLSDPRHGHFVKMTLNDKFGIETWCNYTGYVSFTPSGGTRCPGPPT